MTELAKSSCVACRRDAPRVEEAEMRELLTEIPEWRHQVCEGVSQLTRNYTFSNFLEALDFTNAVGAIAEGQGHHPALLTEWGSVGVTWWTHKIKGLHRNDFIMAAKTDQVFNAMP